MKATEFQPVIPLFINGAILAKLNSHLWVKQKMDFTFYKNEIHLVEATGVEPATLCVQGRCSSQLSYAPIIYYVIYMKQHKLTTYEMF